MRKAGALRLPVLPVAFFNNSSLVEESGLKLSVFCPLATWTVVAFCRKFQT